MKAALLDTIPADLLRIGEVTDPSPGPGELLVEVEACGVCGTDLHILDGTSYRPATPFVLGHEPVGRVVAAADRTDAGWIGRRVTITLFTGCGKCTWCQRGDERLCPDMNSIAGVLGAPGGFAELLVVRATQAVEVPASLSAKEAAVLVDAGATAANSVRAIGRPPDGTLVVIGGGPVGHLVAELARGEGWPVIIVQSSALRRGALAAIGHRVVASLDDIDERPSVVVDAAGAPNALPWALDRLVPVGVFVAAAYSPVPGLDLAPAARKELQFVGIRSGRRDDLISVLRAAAGATVRLPMIRTWPLGSINEAIAALRGRQVPGKAVILPMSTGAGLA